VRKIGENGGLCNDAAISVRQIFISFAVNVAASLFVALCTTLGFGPDKWAAYLVAGMPFLITPGALRLGFLFLASLTLFGTYWRPIAKFARARSLAQAIGLQTVTILGFSLPFIVGAFYVNAMITTRSANVITLITNTKISANQSGNYFTNNGAHGLLFMELPPAETGLIFYLIVKAPYSLKVVAADNNTITIGGTTSMPGGSAQSAVVGSALALIGTPMGWISTAETGAWSIN
jgi:hypothetical protein